MQMTKRALRAALLCIWNTAALIAISLVVSYGVVSFFSRDGAVWEGEDFHLFTTQVPVGGRMHWRIDTKSLESCPGDVVTSMVSRTNHGPPAIVTFRRPVLRVGQSTNDSVSSVQLPESVFPGRWIVTNAIESRCPKRNRLDTLATFEIEVTP